MFWAKAREGGGGLIASYPQLKSWGYKDPLR